MAMPVWAFEMLLAATWAEVTGARMRIAVPTGAAPPSVACPKMLPTTLVPETAAAPTPPACKPTCELPILFW